MDSLNCLLKWNIFFPYPESWSFSDKKENFICLYLIHKAKPDSFGRFWS